MLVLLDPRRDAFGTLADETLAVLVVRGSTSAAISSSRSPIASSASPTHSEPSARASSQPPVPTSTAASSTVATNVP